MNNFEEQVKQWVILDNQLKILNDKTHALREQKNDLCKQLFEHVQNKKLPSSATIPINDGKLKFITTHVAQPLTFKYVEKSLGEVIRNESQVKQIIEYLKQKREIKSIPEIKRFSS